MAQPETPKYSSSDPLIFSLIPLADKIGKFFDNHSYLKTTLKVSGLMILGAGVITLAVYSPQIYARLQGPVMEIYNELKPVAIQGAALLSVLATLQLLTEERGMSWNPQKLAIVLAGFSTAGLASGHLLGLV